MKLWEKGYQLDQLVETFMTGDDPYLDQSLIDYDCMGSIAHAKMLNKIGVLTVTECEQLTQELLSIIELNKAGKFIIQFQDEDVHTAIENALIAKLGDLGKKLHTARSRNDQVLLDMRLYAKDNLVQIIAEALNVCEVLYQFAKKHQQVPIPGRTHFQRAMPSSVGLWAGAFVESFLDNIELLKNAYQLINQCPLGSAASYGVSLDIDRQYTSVLLGFDRVQNNVLYVNNSRGKFESVILSGLVQVMNDLSKISTDIILFCAPEFGYFILPEKFCPGSSLMPQKRNPCPLELIRAKSATVQGMLFQVLEIIRGLPSGYNRDFQETKRPLMQGFEVTRLSLKVFASIFAELEVDKEQCIGSFTTELFATDKVLSLVREGIPFRDAYKKVANELDEVAFCDPVENILSKTHMGATGNLGLEFSLAKIKQHQLWLVAE
ncbi:argininosuccinate lyase [Candidatus Berkiella aquae]|uniref:Argininosuccinate lyase n=1 Tax=Candidatus Berkiella aquae TaxID=295108 RepID=A0A0Q9Z0D0_9GAMM|nr:argininosuccinate lyase [Candidatus Berkiella aquae]MCS5711920.1 argininosuccinate lyase [Candidatus Berkiella aquae]